MINSSDVPSGLEGPPGLYWLLWDNVQTPPKQDISAWAASSMQAARKEMPWVH